MLQTRKRFLAALTATTVRRWMIPIVMGSANFCAPSAFGGIPISKEYQVKAAFLFNFTKFVAWPAQASRPPEAGLVIGVFGRNPFGDELDAAVQGRSIDGRTIAVRFVKTVAEAHRVDLLFVPAGEEGPIARDIDSLHAAGVLTVGESNEFARNGAIITFGVKAGRIRFQINREAAARARIKISPQLLKLGVSEKRA